MTTPNDTVSAQPRRAWQIVTMREVMVKLTNRSFIISTLLTSLLILGGVLLSGFLAGKSSEETVAVASDDGQQIVAEAAQARGGGDDTLRAEQVESTEAAREAVAEEETDAALLDTNEGWVLLQENSIDSSLADDLDRSVADHVMAINAEEAGTSLAELQQGAVLDTELLEPDDQAIQALLVGFVFAFLFYMAAMIYGMEIANSVLEEKQNRIVEILATAIPIRQLLYGKVLGTSLLAFGQLLLYALLGLLAVNLTDLSVDVASLLNASGWFIGFFVAGFAAVAAVWAVLGSMASRSEDLQSSMMPILAVLMVTLFFGIYAKGTVLAVGSFVPVVSSVAMPVRLMQEDVAVWQPIVAFVLAGVAAYLLLRLAERIYSRAVMRTGGALSWRSALQLEA